MKEFKATSTEGLTRDLINGYKIVTSKKYFSSGIFQDYLVFIPAKKYISGTTRIYSWNSNEMFRKY